MNSTRPTSKVETFLLVTAIVIAFLYLYGLYDLYFASLLSNVLTPIGAFVAFLVGLYALMKSGVRRNDRTSMVWLAYTLGMFFWFLGEATWAFYSLVLGIETPYPSIADGFWLVGYLPFAVATVVQAWPFREAFSSRNLVIPSIMTLILAIIVLAVLVPPILSPEGAQDIVTQAVSIAYPLLDVVLLMVGVPVFLLFMKGTFWRPFLFVLIAIILNLVADILFGWTASIGTYYTGHPIDLLYQWAYLAFAFGFYLRLRQRSALTK